MELLKDLVKYFLEGMAEWWAECKISSKRQEYFVNKKSKSAKVCYYGTVSIGILLVVIGIIACIREKVLEGIICMSISGGIGIWLLVERGTAEK